LRNEDLPPPIPNQYFGTFPIHNYPIYYNFQYQKPFNENILNMNKSIIEDQEYILEEDEDNYQWVLSDEAAELFAKSELRRRQKEIFEKELREKEEHEFIEERLERLNNKEKYLTDYGEKSINIRQLEAQLDAIYDHECDKRNPSFWPVVEINTIKR